MSLWLDTFDTDYKRNTAAHCEAGHSTFLQNGPLYHCKVYEKNTKNKMVDQFHPMVESTNG